MRVASLTVFDETASVKLFLPEFPAVRDAEVFSQLQTGSVLILEQAAVILDSSGHMLVTLPSAKYSKV